MANAGLSATVGIRNPGGNVNGDFLQWSFRSPELHNEQTILFSPQAVPEPSTLVLLVAAAGLLVGVRWRGRRFRQRRSTPASV